MGSQQTDLRRAGFRQRSPVQEGTHMFVVRKVCDLGVGSVRHESAFEPLNELALEATNVSVIEMSHT